MANRADDIYWGEFPEADLDRIIGLMKAGDFGAAKVYIDEKLGRTDFIFGKARTDFMYYMNLDKGARCLDVGCGLGVHSFNFAPYVKEVIGFDQSAKRAEFCALRAKAQGVSNVSFQHASIATVAVKPESFDNIVMNGVLEWVPEAKINADPRQDQIDVLKHMKALLTDRGILYVGIENRFAINYLTSARDHNRLRYTTFMPRFLASLFTKIFRGKPYRTYTYSAYGYKKLFKEAGFDEDKISIYIAHPGYNLPKYLIPFEDREALKFFMKALMSGKGWKGRLVQAISRFDFVLRFVRHGFYSYAIYARK